MFDRGCRRNRLAHFTRDTRKMRIASAAGGLRNRRPRRIGKQVAISNQHIRQAQLPGHIPMRTIGIDRRWRGRMRLRHGCKSPRWRLRTGRRRDRWRHRRRIWPSVRHSRRRRGRTRHRVRARNPLNHVRWRHPIEDLCLVAVNPRHRCARPTR